MSLMERAGLEMSCAPTTGLKGQQCLESPVRDSTQDTPAPDLPQEIGVPAIIGPAFQGPTNYSSLEFSDMMC